MALADFTSKFFLHRQAGRNNDITVVEILPSHLTDEDNIEVFGNGLFAIVGQFDSHRIVIDAQHVIYATSSVLGKLITLHRRVHRADGRLILASVKDDFAVILQTGRLHTYFDIVDTVAAAVIRMEDE